MTSRHRALAIPVALVLLVTVSCLCIPIGRPDLKFAPEALPDGRVGVPYQADVFVAQNETPVGDMYISEGSLPRGLTLVKLPSEDVGRIGGTPEESGSFTFTVSVWCYGTSINGQTGNITYTLVIGN
jgi:hypothetical protein